MASPTIGSDPARWIELTEGKHLSRLLYTNPVCLLCTVGETTVPQGRNDDEGNDTETQPPTSAHASTSPPAVRNVMVLSWLTASNNEGRFMFSVCKRRFSSARLLPDSQFTLCVPVRGMEELVRNVGATTGRFGSKFPEDYSPAGADDIRTATGRDWEHLSKRQKRKLKSQTVCVSGLRTIPVGERPGAPDEQSVFAIDGTVAHMVCCVDRVLETMDNGDLLIDADHKLVVGQIERAFVQSAYWDSDKALFRPAPGALPYLTFFGSQMFGYVVVGDDQNGNS